MPCNDDNGGMPYPESAASDRDLNKLEKAYGKQVIMLCSACKTLEKHKISIPTNVTKWWTQHKKVDAARELKEKKIQAAVSKREKLEEAQAKKIKSALKKLTVADREILGL